MSGRFAPSPTGDLHVGNLRTALVSWLDAATAGLDWLVRFEDLDQVVSDRATAEKQLASLAALGMEPSQPPLWQSDERGRYDNAIATLEELDLTYPCFCSRREIREAIAASAVAPNGPAGPAYPGTCAGLSARERRARSAERPPALRFRSGGSVVDFDDENYGVQSFPVDDFVVRRNDGVAAYNLVVVVDDAAQNVTRVVRADDLLSSTARQILVAHALDLSVFAYAHVPLVVNPAGDRLTKRDGAMTIPDLEPLGWTAAHVMKWICDSMGINPGDPIGSWNSRRPIDEWSNEWRV